MQRSVYRARRISDSCFPASFAEPSPAESRAHDDLQCHYVPGLKEGRSGKEAERSEEKAGSSRRKHTGGITHTHTDEEEWFVGFLVRGVRKRR